MKDLITRDTSRCVQIKCLWKDRCKRFQQIQIDCAKKQEGIVPITEFKGNKRNQWGLVLQCDDIIK